MTATAAPENQSPAGRTIVSAGLVAGVLDIGYVFIYFNRGDLTRAARTLRGITAGLLGLEAVKDGGAGLAALGLLLHFTIALAAAAVFYAASRKLDGLTRHPIGSGLSYGMVVWLVMNLVVLPLSANPPKSFPPPGWIPVLIAHLFCVGLPIALLVRKLAPVTAPAPA